ncbi:MAG: zinc-binding dehydrogenase [Candidatus Methylomirabilales bacterium]
MKIRSVYLIEPGRVELREREISVGPRDVLVRGFQASICGTDKMFFQGQRPPPNPVAKGKGFAERHTGFPLPLGHEGGGEVIEVGGEVREFAPGDWVMVLGWHNVMGDYWVAPDAGVLKIPDGISPEVGALGEPLSCAMYAGLQSGVELGDWVAVVGMGFAGQVIAQVAKGKGAHRVIAVDVVPEKLALAESLGADRCIHSGEEDPVEQIMRWTDKRGVDVVIEAAGSEQAVNTASAILRSGGILGIYSWIVDPVRLNVSRWHDDGFDIRTLALMHRVGPDRRWWLQRSLVPVAQGMVRVEPLITHRFPLDQVSHAFEAAVKDPTACKVALTIP